MKKFEYTIYECGDRDLKDETLNEFGIEGWELVTHSTVAQLDNEYGYSIWHYVIFRRPLVAAEESCNDNDGWSYDEWQEHQKKMTKLARELKEMREQ